MTENQSWLSDVIVINESSDERIPGDVSAFRSAGEACRYLEYWWVEEGHGFAFTASGERLILGVFGREVTVEAIEPHERGAEIVRTWLEALAAAVLDARRHRASKGRAVLSGFEERGELPRTTEGLLAYVGFEQ